MNEYDKLRAKNIAEKDAILAKFFREVKNDHKPKKREELPEKRENMSNHKKLYSNNDNNDVNSDEEEESEQSENKPPQKRKLNKPKEIEKKQYNLRTRPVTVNTSSESNVSDEDSTSSHERNHYNTYKTRSWYHQKQNQTENNVMITRSNGKRNHTKAPEQMRYETMKSSENIEH